MIKKVAIVDYGMGNLYSVRHALSHLGAGVDIVSRPEGLDACDALILPGVGAFGDAMKELKSRRLLKALSDFIASGRPFLGICLGMQILMERSEESPGIDGLGVIPGRVKKFLLRPKRVLSTTEGPLKCPHMGWNRILKRAIRDRIFKGLKGNIFVYFCHSYYVAPEARVVVVGETDYGVFFPSVIRRENVYGMQFHPEKSQEAGLRILQNFLSLC